MSNDVLFESTTVPDYIKMHNEEAVIESFTFKKDERSSVVAFRGVATSKGFDKLLSGGYCSITERTLCEKRLLLTAIKNYIKINNALQLNLQLAEGEIDEGEYERILDEDEEKYFICINRKISMKEFDVLCRLVKEIGNDFSVEDVSEMFSVDLTSVEEKLLGKTLR